MRARLTLALVVLTTVGLLLLGVTTTWITTTAVSSIVDDKLDNSIASLDRMVAKTKYDGDDEPPKPFVEFTTQSAGSIIAMMRDGRVVDSAIFTNDAAPRTLSPEAIAAFEQATMSDGLRVKIDLPGLGTYLMQVRDTDDGTRLIAAVSLNERQNAATWSTVITFGVGLLTLVGMGLATIAIVRRETQPLERVAAAADTVSSLPLHTGEVSGIPRLDDGDIDDRTEAGRVAGAMNRMLEHVDAALATRAATDRRMRQFVTDASHELRTPLASIQGYAELTRQESDVLPPLTEASLARIESEAARMTMLVGDLLLLSRLDEGQGGLRSEPVDLCHLGQVAVNDARTVSPGWLWRTQLPDEPIFVDGDHSAITQIVTNLLRNATTHTPEGTRVTLRVRPPLDGTVELVVADTGPGVDPEFEPTLFQRFARNDKSRSRRHGSTGLGLAIVAALVDAHGGSIRHERGDVTAGAPGDDPHAARTGASFIVSLPAWNDELNELETDRAGAAS